MLHDPVPGNYITFKGEHKLGINAHAVAITIDMAYIRRWRETKEFLEPQLIGFSIRLITIKMGYTLFDYCIFMLTDLFSHLVYDLPAFVSYPVAGNKRYDGKDNRQRSYAVAAQ